MLAILPYLEQMNLYSQWDFRRNVVGNAGLASLDIVGFYCPSRRVGLRTGDSSRMLVALWRGGGTDYGGCLGAGNGWNNNAATHTFSDSPFDMEQWYNRSVLGIFSPNVSTSFAAIRDGASNTLMTGELQRLTPEPGATGNARYTRISQDGWALGGVATLFTTAMRETHGTFQTGGMNNNFFESPGSDHAGGAHFGMADGSVHFFDEGMAQETLYYLGAMADGKAVQPP